MRAFLGASDADAAEVERLWALCSERMYSLPPRQRQLGLGSTKGVTTYFSANCEEADAALCSEFLGSIGLSPYNTRLFKASVASLAAVRYTVLWRLTHLVASFVSPRVISHTSRNSTAPPPITLNPNTITNTNTNANANTNTHTYSNSTTPPPTRCGSPPPWGRRERTLSGSFPG